MDKNKRKRIEKLVYDVFTALDPTGANTARYQDMLGKMKDAEFDKFIKELLSNENNYLILDMADYERDLKMENVEAAAKVLGIPLYEYIVKPHVNGDIENPVVSKFPVPVMYLHMKRMQQMVNKKNSTSIESSKRNMLTGQVTGEDKNSRSSDMENLNLVAINANETLKELLGPRADDNVMKNEMLQQIALTGNVTLSNMTNDLENKTALNTLNVFFTGMGFRTDLITKDGSFPGMNKRK